MKTLQNKASNYFALSAAGFITSLALSFAAANPEPKPQAAAPAQPAQVSLELSKPEPAAPPVPETPAPVELNPESVKKGKQNYDMFCLSCHGPEDVGIDSPSNLFDSKWHHGAGRSGIELTIRNGIMEKGMPGWGAMIPAEDITALVDYLISFEKQNASTDEKRS
ncbi:c-type cytochrome [Pelagicoccus mobilis]|uniref:Cytochrome c n=1 Tax=Pelagicoccus mobilis TaxID=415221 RepID=A0A934VQV1_9BACT|nr:cytochrome c [Pelagicoccus mobilis]MBK1876953.1 cytochrome c [Pelagicoccus mobilis]